VEHAGNEVLGSVELKGASVRWPSKEPGDSTIGDRRHCFVVRAAHKDYVLQAASEAEHRDWMEAFYAHCQFASANSNASSSSEPDAVELTPTALGNSGTGMVFAYISCILLVSAYRNATKIQNTQRKKKKDAGAEAFDWTSARTTTRSTLKLATSAGRRYAQPLTDWQLTFGVNRSDARASIDAENSSPVSNDDDDDDGGVPDVAPFRVLLVKKQNTRILKTVDFYRRPKTMKLDIFELKCKRH
jgi:hypothetical protein